MDEMQQSELKDVIWDLLSSVINKEVSVSNWPDVYSDAAFNNMAQISIFPMKLLHISRGKENTLKINKHMSHG